MYWGMPVHVQVSVLQLWVASSQLWGVLPSTGECLYMYECMSGCGLPLDYLSAVRCTPSVYVCVYWDYACISYAWLNSTHWQSDGLLEACVDSNTVASPVMWRNASAMRSIPRVCHLPIQCLVLRYSLKLFDALKQLFVRCRWHSNLAFSANYIRECNNEKGSHSHRLLVIFKWVKSQPIHWPYL